MPEKDGKNPNWFAVYNFNTQWGKKKFLAKSLKKLLGESSEVTEQTARRNDTGKVETIITFLWKVVNVQSECVQWLLQKHCVML